MFCEGDGKGGDPKAWEAITNQLVYPFFDRHLYQTMGNPTDLEYIAAQYDSEIRYCDDSLGKFFETLKSMGLWDDTAIIITSDHGESMTEHHVYFGHHGIYDCILYVPLIIRLPNGGKPNNRIEDMFQHIDIAPTICDILGLGIPGQFEGRSLLPAICGKDMAGYDAIYSCEASLMAKWAIRTNEWKFLKNIDPVDYHVDYDELYHVARDTSESHNVIDQYPDIADRLELQLNRWKDAHLGGRPDPVRLVTADGSPMENTKIEGLEALGMTFDEWIADYKRRFVSA